MIGTALVEHRLLDIEKGMVNRVKRKLGKLEE